MGWVHVCQVAQGPVLSVPVSVQRDIKVLSTRCRSALRRVLYEVVCNTFVIYYVQLSSGVHASSETLIRRIHLLVDNTVQILPVPIENQGIPASTPTETRSGSTPRGLLKQRV